MRRAALILFCAAALAGCATTKVGPPAQQWERRMLELQQASGWQLDGRAAVAIGTQGWQATLNWRQIDRYAEVHLSGPFGIGALVLRQQPAGLSLNGAQPSDAVLAQLQERLGFELPLENLRFWLLGVPDPSVSSELARNDQDRARQITQAGWSILYDRYMPVDADLLPARLVLSREDVRVRIVIDRWNWPR
jgi:outer membrane lipoprotein LolB